MESQPQHSLSLAHVAALQGQCVMLQEARDSGSDTGPWCSWLWAAASLMPFCTNGSSVLSCVWEMCQKEASRLVLAPGPPLSTLLYVEQLRCLWWTEWRLVRMCTDPNQLMSVFIFSFFAVPRTLHPQEAQVTIECAIPQKFHRSVMGPKGSRIQQITRDYNVQIKFPDREENPGGSQR